MITFDDTRGLPEDVKKHLDVFEDMIGDLDGKTLAIAADDNTFIDDGTIVAEDYVEAFNGIVANVRALRRALFMCASHCQGGHSGAGDAAAEALGIPFPVTMDNLRAKAISDGLDPADLWPWMERQRAKRQPAESQERTSMGAEQ